MTEDTPLPFDLPAVSSKKVAVLPRAGKTPSGAEVRTLLKQLVRRIRRHWPRTRLTFRGDSHYGRAEAMTWCEVNGVGLLADARPARCCASKDDARLRRFATLRQSLLKIGARVVEEAAPHPHPRRFGLSGRRPVPPADRAPRGLGPLITVVPCPANPSPFNPKPRHYQPQILAPRGAERQYTRS